jgi:DNA-directed RNA polymerase specialized sigma24 family protein
MTRSLSWASSSRIQSTFAQALETHVPNFVRCNQDDLGNRRAVEDAAQRALARGLHAVIDRTNVDPS